MSKREFLVFLFKRKWTIGPMFFGVTALTTVLLYVLPPDYRAQSQVLVERNKAPGLRTELLPGLEMAEVINTEVAIVVSRTVMERVVDRLRLQDLPRRVTVISRIVDAVRGGLIAAGLIYETDRREKWIRTLMNEVKVKPALDSNVFMIRYSHENPRLAGDIVNAVTDEYIAHHVRIYSFETTAGFFRASAERAKDEWSGLGKELKNYKDKSSLAAILAKKNSLVDEMRALDERVASLRLELADVLQKYEEQHPKAAVIRSKIETIEEQIAQARRQLQDLERDEARVLELTSRIRFQEDTYRAYRSQYDQSVLAALGSQSVVNVHVVDRAEVPARPRFPRIFFIAIAILGGGILAMGTAMIQEYYDRRVSTPESVERILGVAVIGSIGKHGGSIP